MFPDIGVLAASALLCAAPPQELTLEQVVKANTAAVQAIRSIHVTIHQDDDFYPLPGTNEYPSEPLPNFTIEWFQDGKRERVRKIFLRGKGARVSRAPEDYDGYNGPDGWKRLEHYDPDFTPSLSESISGPAVGVIDKTQPSKSISGELRSSCNMEPFRLPTEVFLTKHPSCKLAATPATSKLGCYEITRLQEKSQSPFESGGTPDDVRELRIFMDPKAGFWVRRIEGGAWQKSTNPADKGTMIDEIQEFKDCGNGIFWPIRDYKQFFAHDGKVQATIINRYALHSINQPLPDEDFHVPFPDWLRIFDRVSGKVSIWGPDNKPRMEFASRAEYEEWYRPRARNPFSPQIPSPREYWTYLVGTCVAVALLLLTLIAWRRRAARVVARSSPEAGNT